MSTQAQGPQLSLQATPSPFGPGATISINASVTRTGWFDCPNEAPPYVFCVLLASYASAEVYGPNSFWQAASAWDDHVTLQTSDPGPGQTMQPGTYQLYGAVVLTYCYWSVFHGDCVTEPEDYVEVASTQASVQPQPAPGISGLSPASGLMGATVTISGANFTGTPGSVSFTPRLRSPFGRLRATLSSVEGSGCPERSRRATVWRPACRCGRAPAWRPSCRPGRRPAPWS